MSSEGNESYLEQIKIENKQGTLISYYKDAGFIQGTINKNDVEPVVTIVLVEISEYYRNKRLCEELFEKFISYVET